jgi:hypothetical protein
LCLDTNKHTTYRNTNSPEYVFSTTSCGHDTPPNIFYYFAKINGKNKRRLHENTEDYVYRWGIMGIYGDIG